MVFNVRCFKCGELDVRLVLGGRAILHARCHSCQSNLLAEIMAMEEEIMEEKAAQAAEAVESAADAETDVSDEEEYFDENPTTRSIPAMPDLPDLSEFDTELSGAE